MLRSAKVFFLALITVQTAFATDVELICPCEVRSGDQTSMIVKAGVANQGATASGNLRLRVIAHSTRSHFDSSFYTLGFYHFRGASTSLDAGQSIASTDFETGISIPSDDTFFVTLFLEEKESGVWSKVDFIRMQQPVALAQAGGYSLNSGNDDRHAAVFFDGTPAIVTSGSQVTIDLPPIVNNSISTTTGNLKVQLLQTNEPTVFCGDNCLFVTAEADLGVALEPGTQTGSVEITTAFNEAFDTGFDYFHLAVIDTSTNAILVFQTVLVRSGSVSSREFTLHSIEMLADDDNDGVSNYNERLVGTNPSEPNSVPGDSTIDLIFFYTPGTADAVVGNDVQARLDQLLTVTNQIYQQSDANTSFRVVHTEEVSGLDESTPLSEILDMMLNEAPPFEGLRALKESSSADLAVVFLPLPYPPGDVCGRGTLTGKGLEGDFASNSLVHDANATVYIDCRDNVTAHEIGHVMGLSHSRREMESENDPEGGTFPWSVGYGIDGTFVTVMAYSDTFSDAPELNVFSSPHATCEGVPCGIDHLDQANGADAVLSLNTTRHQVATFTPVNEANIDTDNDGISDAEDTDDDSDGVPDVSDLFPKDDGEWDDTDNDGIGNNADTDDDGDGVVDSEDAFPLDASETNDSDGDGIGDNSDVPARLNPAQTIALPVTERALTAPDGGALTVPLDATAVSLNVTAVNPDGAGYVTVWPCSVERPVASNLNYVAGDIVPNGVIAPVGTEGKVCFYSYSESDLVVDIAGWYQGDAFVGTTPQRLVDSRKGTGAPKEKLEPSSPLGIQITGVEAATPAGSAITVPADITAAALNVTVVNPAGGGYVTVYPCDADRPLASNVNFVKDQVVANGVVAPVSGSGKVCVYVSTDTDIVVDLAGWITGTSFAGATPNRLVDTRDGTGGHTGKITNTDELGIPVDGQTLTVNGNTQVVPSTASAAALNVTAVDPVGGGYITVYPCGVDRPLASNLNYVKGDVVANNVIAPIGDNGSICVYSSTDSDVVVDISGWFEGDATNGFVGSTPKRVIDTREAVGPPPR